MSFALPLLYVGSLSALGLALYSLSKYQTTQLAAYRSRAVLSAALAVMAIMLSLVFRQPPADSRMDRHLADKAARTLEQLEVAGRYTQDHYPGEAVILVVTPQQSASASLAEQKARFTAQLDPGTEVSVHVLDYETIMQADHQQECRPRTAAIAAALDLIVATHQGTIIVDLTQALGSGQVGASGVWLLPEDQRPHLISAQALMPENAAYALSQGWLEATFISEPLWDQGLPPTTRNTTSMANRLITARDLPALAQIWGDGWPAGSDGYP